MPSHKPRIALASLCAWIATASPSDVEVAFKEFKAKYGRRYSSEKEEKERFEIFANKYKYIQAENAKGQSFHLVINKFADQAQEEFNSTRLGLSSPSTTTQWVGLPRLGVADYSGVSLPSSVDWVSKGGVTPVKNQGKCGSCWSFSTTGALEGAWFASTGKLVSLSEQQLVDCSTENKGCDGGNVDLAFTYLQNRGICTEQSYRYTGAQYQRCQERRCDVAIPTGSIVGYYDVPPQNEQALMQAVAQQPVSVAIEADQKSFQLYGGGVLTRYCGDRLDHGVLLVGYGTDGGKDYWKIKNSWGPDWGEEGFVRIERGRPGAGQCGVKTMASYPKISGSHPPSPSPAPSPGPRPSPANCEDKEDFCTDKDIFDPAKDCIVMAGMCDKTCGLCGGSNGGGFFSQIGGWIASFGKWIWSGIKGFFGLFAKLGKWIASWGHHSNAPHPPHRPYGPCRDSDPDLCQSPFTFNPTIDCQLTPGICKDTCGCCSSMPKQWCQNLHSDSSETVTV